VTAVRKSVIVPHSAQVMYELVDDFERYPEFLPWCKSATMLERTAEGARGRLELDFSGFKGEIVTVNHNVAGRSIALELEDGPFTSFKGLWTFSPLGDTGSRVTLAVDYTFASGALQSVTAPVFGRITGSLVERFVQRAEEVA
jgi:ribosome-associated toxin RatA of RatAB toxin-antitoxin module